MRNGLKVSSKAHQIGWGYGYELYSTSSKSPTLYILPTDPAGWDDTYWIKNYGEDYMEDNDIDMPERALKFKSKKALRQFVDHLRKWLKGDYDEIKLNDIFTSADNPYYELVKRVYEDYPDPVLTVDFDLYSDDPVVLIVEKEETEALILQLEQWLAGNTDLRGYEDWNKIQEKLKKARAETEEQAKTEEQTKTEEQAKTGTEVKNE